MAKALANCIFLIAMMLSPHLSPATATATATITVRDIERPSISPNASCEDWLAWVPPASSPAVVMQVVSKDFIKVQKNFVRLMEKNSDFTRRHILLICVDNESVEFFAGFTGIDCLPLGGWDRGDRDREDVWILRVRVLSCLVKAGYDVLMSDSDALWLQDPTKSFNIPGAVRSNIVASRGAFPPELANEWGATMCMGFILLRAGSKETMSLFLDLLEELVVSMRDDQRAVNQAAKELGIVWDQDGSDMRYEASTGFGVGAIKSLVDNSGRSFKVTLLPHRTFTRLCETTPISNDTVVAHCYQRKREEGQKKIAWMKKANLWGRDGNKLH